MAKSSMSRPQLQNLMSDWRLCAILRTGKLPASSSIPRVRSTILHFWLAYDHPFLDGNGRTARALFYWSMLHHGYWLCEFISISSLILKAPAEYERAFLYTETDENDLTYFIIYHLELIRLAVDELHKYIARKTEQLRRVERELRGVAILNHRQRRANRSCPSSSPSDVHDRISPPQPCCRVRNGESGPARPGRPEIAQCG